MSCVVSLIDFGIPEYRTRMHYISRKIRIFTVFLSMFWGKIRLGGSNFDCRKLIFVVGTDIVIIFFVFEKYDWVNG